MRLLIVAVGRLKAGPEADLTADYVARAQAIARGIGLKGVELVEVEGRPAGDARREAAALLKATPDDAVKILLDERGEAIASRQIAEKIAAWRDQGRGTAVFWIGGADGAAQGLKDQADEKWAFGRQTWPHRLVRAMLAEQLYRASTLLSHSPYHRD